MVVLPTAGTPISTCRAKPFATLPGPPACRKLACWRHSGQFPPLLAPPSVDACRWFGEAAQASERSASFAGAAGQGLRGGSAGARLPFGARFPGCRFSVGSCLAHCPIRDCRKTYPRYKMQRVPVEQCGISELRPGFHRFRYARCDQVRPGHRNGSSDRTTSIPPMHREGAWSWARRQQRRGLVAGRGSGSTYHRRPVRGQRRLAPEPHAVAPEPARRWWPGSPMRRPSARAPRHEICYREPLTLKWWPETLAKEPVDFQCFCLPCLDAGGSHRNDFDIFQGENQ